VVFAFILWGIYTGFFTPTEAGALGAFSVLILAVARKKLSWGGFRQAILSAGWTTGLVTIIVVGTQVFNGFLVITRVPFNLADIIIGLPLPSIAIMGLIILIYIICGFFMDVFALIFITVPIFYPIVIQMGYDPVWFGVMICLVAGLGGITPPYGLIIFALRTSVPDIPMWTMFRGCFPFVGANLVAVVLLLIFPQIAYWLPYLGKVT
jgi:tripartite ATP-independent transporter DctM subunit